MRTDDKAELSSAVLSQLWDAAMTVGKPQPDGEQSRRMDMSSTQALVALHIVVTLLSVGLSQLMSTAYLGCEASGSICDYSVTYEFQVAALIIGAVLTLAMIVGMYLLRQRHRNTWWVPLLGSASIIMFSVINYLSVLHAAAL